MRSYRLSIPLHGPRRGRGRLILPGEDQIQPLPALWRLVLAMAIAGLLSIMGCATTPRDISMGARQALHQVKVHKVVLLPMVAPAPFGLSPQEQQDMLRLYEAQAQKRLLAQGLQVVTAQEVRQQLPQEELEERLDLDDQLLGEVFEDNTRGLHDRRALVAELGQAFGADAVLVGQVIYHSTATCDPNQESPYTPHVFVVHGEPEGQEPVPCAISHFEAKLVQASTGQTLWYNRALRELRASRADASTPDSEQNARDNVDLVFLSPYAGLDLRAPSLTPGS